MLSTDDNADDHAPVVRWATPLSWFACHGSQGVDAVADIDGDTHVWQVKHLVPPADAKRIARQSVLVLLNACESSDDHHRWASSVQQLKSMSIAQDTDIAMGPLASGSSSESAYLLAAAWDPCTPREASTFTGVYAKLLTDSLSRWASIAGRMPLICVLDGLDEARPAERPCPLQAIAAAQHASSAAYKARDAVIHEHPSVSRDEVARFTSTWLGLRPTPEIVEATAETLLYAALDDFDPDDDSAAVRRLRLDTIHHNRLLKPLTATQLCHYPIDSLDRPLRIDLDDDMPATLADTVGVPGHVDELITRIGGWEDDRIDKILARLHDDERQVALAYAHLESPATWQQAAHSCGLSAEFGEKVRRKLRREGEALKAIQPRSPGRTRAA